MSVTLLFGVHAHQPAGNLPEVLDRAHERCYGPFLRVLARFPEFRFALHASGPLLAHLAMRYPGDIGLLRAMVERGQVELFGGGDAEPVLAAIPERDRRAQLDALGDRLQAMFGARPRGAWLTERVWEATVVPALVAAGFEYVTVDDYHFLCAGRSRAELAGFFTTEEGGQALDLFPIAEALRYRLPFAPAPEAVAFIEALDTGAGGAAAICFDDLEKFGLWPGTHEWVYGRGWLEMFVRGVLESPRIETATFGAYRARHRSRGIVYLPSVSYIEMNEWTLPPAQARAYGALVGREREGGRYDADKAFLRGGIWKGFLARYPEANWMHKRMLRLSDRLAAAPQALRTPAMRALLHLAQANDAYWHGLFGGLYLPHLRRGVYRALLALEADLDRVCPRAPRERLDLDLDGIDEIVLQNGELQAIVKLDGAAAVVELDAYALAQNFGDTLRRHAEAYHAEVLGAADAHHDGPGIASAHELTRRKHPIAAADLEHDERPRSIFRETWIDGAGARVIDEYEALPAGAVEHAAGFRARCGGGTIEKHLLVQGARLTAWFSLAGVGAGRLRTELNLALPSCDGFAGRYILRGEIPGGFGQPVDADDVSELALDDRFMRGTVTLLLSRPAALRARPLHTVSRSEAGFEKIMQCVTIELEWPVGPGTSELSATLRIVADPPEPGSGAPGTKGA